MTSKSKAKPRSSGWMLPIMHPDAAGIDIGAEEIFVAVPPDRDINSVRPFGTFTRDLIALADWLRQCNIRSVAMESTGVYWIPLYQILETHGFEVFLVNAHHVKNVPGRKSDVSDCQWIQYLHSVGIRPLLKLSRETINRSQKLDYALVSSLERDPMLAERLERLRTVPEVGPITALTWVLEIGDVARFQSIKQAISYCGLCGAEKSSADKVMRTPISKQRNKHIQQVLVEAAKLAPRQSHELALIYEKEKQRGNRNRATLAVARKMVAWMLAVERRKQDFVPAEEFGGTVAA